MKYLALLRGINVGGKKKVEMNRLKDLFSNEGFQNISTYLNTGNIVFESKKKQEDLQLIISKKIQEEFDFDIPMLTLTSRQFLKISEIIPEKWMNNKEEKTDIAFLFPEIDSIDLVNQLPLKREYINIKYVKGAVIWNLKMVNYNKSHLNKVIQTNYYKSITVRNVNTVRNLVGLIY